MTPELSTELVQRWLDPARKVTAVRQLNGGMLNRVWAWELDGEPGSVVCKLNTLRHGKTFQREHDALQWYRQHTAFPVPSPYACFVDHEADVSGLLMARAPGVTLAEARLSAKGMARVQQQMAAHVASLHTHTGRSFGPAGDGHERQTRWVEVFGQAIEREFHAVRDRLSSRHRDIAHTVIHHLDDWLPEQAQPTLVHGDLWTTNILVDDSHEDRPTITAFIDPAATYADPEYELAYLRLFHTADDTFFAAYARHHPLRPGFDRRCRVYWLNSMLIHVRLFGDRYTPACEDVIQQLRQLS